VSALVIDPSDLLADAALPFLVHALDPREAARLLAPAILGSPTPKGSALGVEAVHVLRHKPGRRCLLEYRLLLSRDRGPDERVTVLGKVRARGLDAATPRLHAALRSAGFGLTSHDGVTVPEPLGLVPELRMWLQRKEPGTPLTRLLLGPDGPTHARRAAEAIGKLHAARVPPSRVHTVADEMRILSGRLSELADARPELRRRLERLVTACARLASTIREPEATGVHRDFHPDQLLVDGERIVLVDLDLYASGDPAVDAGNFLAHVTELALRTHGGPRALDGGGAGFRERFLALYADPDMRARVRAYELLTLARHVALSIRYPDRVHTTEPLLALCEGELGISAYPASR
jgi:hypothetical protein